MLDNKIITENILKEKLSDDITLSVIKNEYPLSNNPSFPDIYETNFIVKLLTNRFKEIKQDLKNIGSINNIKSDNLYTGLSELILKCKKIEKPFRNELEKICYNIIVDLFSIPEDTINLEINLMDSINLSNSNITIDPIDGDDDYSLNDVKEAINFKNEIHKRRLLIALCVGGAMEMSKNINMYFNEINKLSPELCDLYHKILTINEYLLFEKENINITDKNNMQIGNVEVFLGNDENKVIIKSQATIFPILLFETIRGFFELFISHGLPKEKYKAIKLLQKTDYLKSEPWYMRIGPSLWNLFYNSMDNIDSNYLPYLLKNVSSIKWKNFNFLMKEIFAKTKKSKKIMSSLLIKSKDEMDYNKFVNKMDKIKSNKSIITDEFIQIEEL
jgi:hypothetical protein